MNVPFKVVLYHINQMSSEESELLTVNSSRKWEWGWISSESWRNISRNSFPYQEAFETHYMQNTQHVPTKWVGAAELV